MPGKNTDAQNNWLFATNILLSEIRDNGLTHLDQAGAYISVGNIRDTLFDADGNWNFPTPESDVYPNRVELDDVYFTANARTNSTRSWVFFRDSDGDIRAYSSNHDTVRIPSEDHLKHWRNSYEAYRWPNRIEQVDVSLISQNPWQLCTDVLIGYVSLYCSNTDYQGDFDRDGYYEWRDRIEARRWPNRVQQDDINFVGMLTNRGGVNESCVYTNDGCWFAAAKGFKSSDFKWPQSFSRNSWENARWPNRVPMEEILGWRNKGHNHVYLSHPDGGGDIFCNNTDGKVTHQNGI